MKAAPFVVVIVAAATLVAAAQDPGKGKIVEVQIVVGNYDAHNNQCKDPKSKVNPTTVFVSTVEKDKKKDVQVHHCVKGVLLDHKSHETNPGAFASTIPKLSIGDQVRWVSNDKKTTFTVQVSRHDPVNALAPANPFEEPLPNQPLTNVLSRPVVDVKGAEILQQYKATFQIVGVGKADPDFVCSM